MLSITNLGVRWLLITGLGGPKPRIITLSPFPPSFVPKLTALLFFIRFYYPKMPYRPESSTVRRRKLAEYVDFFGNTMVKSCSTYLKYKRECRVYIRSGKYSKCIRRG